MGLLNRKLKNKTNVILWDTTYTPDIYNAIQPSKLLLPKWYKDLKIDEGADVARYGVKGCVPFMEGFTTGYSLVTPCDLLVRQVDGDIIVGTSTGAFRDFIARRGDKPGSGADVVPSPEGFEKSQFVWKLPLTLQVPKTHSIIFTHPVNRYDLPFYTMTGVVDANWPMHPGNAPFFIRKGFEGIIPEGTPFAQVIPFKRESWRLERKKGMTEMASQYQLWAGGHFRGWYRKTFWVKKFYE